MSSRPKARNSSDTTARAGADARAGRNKRNGNVSGADAFDGIESLIEQASHRFQQLFQGLPIACFCFDGEGRIHEWNRASEKLYGRSAAEVLQRPIWEIVCRQEHADYIRGAVERALAGETLEGLEWTTLRADGSQIDTLSSVFPLRTLQEGAVVGGVIANVDITSRKHAERALQESHEKLDQRIRERTEELAKANATLRREIADRKRAESALRAEADRLAALIAVQFEIAREELDLEKVMQLIANRTRELARADRCAVWLVDGEELVCRATTGTEGFQAGDRVRLDENLNGDCVRTGEIIWCPDTHKDPRTETQALTRYNIRSLVAVPIHFGSEIVGSFIVLSHWENAFDETDTQILQLMAGLVSTAMEHAVQFEERREAERELQRILAQTEQVLLAIPSALIEIDERGLITTWNAAAKTAFGVSRDDSLGKKLEECPIGWDSALITTAIETCQREAQSIRMDDVRVAQPDGKDRLLGITLTPITTTLGPVTGVLILAADVTDRRMLETQLAQAQKLESIGQLAAGIAHEINTPIQYVGDNLRFLRDVFTEFGALFEPFKRFMERAAASELAEEARSMTEALEKADVDYLMQEAPSAIEQSLEGVQRVAHIVGAMKEFSHPGTSEKIPIDLNHSLESTILVARNEWKYVADMVTDFDPDLPPVLGLPAELNQVFLNLIVNAAHAVADVAKEESGQKGRIAIRTRLVGGQAEIRVEDSGPGVPEAIRSRLFDPFFTTKGVGKGTGQGLTIARSVVVDKHAGTISFDTQPGKGTTFIVRLPLDEPAKMPAAA